MSEVETVNKLVGYKSGSYIFDPDRFMVLETSGGDELSEYLDLGGESWSSLKHLSNVLAHAVSEHEAGRLS